MRPVSVVLAAAGNSPWIPVNRLQVPCNIALFGEPSDGASLTWEVQHTPGPLDIDARVGVSIARVTTTATVTDIAHGLSTGDSVDIIGSGSSNLDGTHDITVTDANTYTYTVANTGLTASIVGCRALRLAVYDHESLTGQTGRADGNYAFPPAAVRFVITAYTSGTLRGTIIQGMGP